MVFYWRPSDNKSPRISRILLSNLDTLNIIMVWMVLVLPLLSNSTSLFTKTLETVPRASTAIYITITLINIIIIIVSYRICINNGCFGF